MINHSATDRVRVECFVQAMEKHGIEVTLYILLGNLKVSNSYVRKQLKFQTLTSENIKVVFVG